MTNKFVKLVHVFGFITKKAGMDVYNLSLASEFFAIKSHNSGCIPREKKLVVTTKM